MPVSRPEHSALQQQCHVVHVQSIWGPRRRTSSTWRLAASSSSSQSFWWRPTSRTHHASASLRLRPIPPSIKASSTPRSSMRSRVMTGTLSGLKRISRSPCRTPQHTLRANRSSASAARATRASLVTSRNPTTSASLCSSPTARISSRSTRTVTGAQNHAAGTDAVKKRAISVVMAGNTSGANLVAARNVVMV